MSPLSASPLRRTVFRTLALTAAVVLVAIPAQGQGKLGKMPQPSLSCGVASPVSIEIVFQAGNQVPGAPAGFSLQWMTYADFLANGSTWFLSSDPALCKGSFSGNASGFFYNLGPGQTTTLLVGDFLFDNPGASTNCDMPLACDTEYVFRAFSHANSKYNRSDFSADLVCKTAACTSDPGCTYTQGYWKTHGPIPVGNNSNEWPVTSLTLGTVAYTDLELLAIFNKPAQGNGLIALAHQLIAAKLNVANGADDTDIAGAIAAADALIGGLVVPPVGTGTLHPSVTSSLTTTLDNYNNGLTGPGHCD